MLLQVGLGHSPFNAGMMIAVSGAAAVLMKSATPPLLRRYGFRTVLTVNGVLVAASMAAAALFTASWPAWAILTVLGISGFFRSLQFTAMNAVGYAELDAERMSAGITTNSIFQQLSQSLGVGLAATSLHLSMAWHGEASVTPAATAPVFVAVALIGALSLIWFAKLSRTVGHEMHSPNLSEPG
jgi:Na+/melibiose symporter-like transporter